jgi:hypothetical protein
MLVLAGGAGLLALWLISRFPERAPRRLAVAVANVVAALVVGWSVGPVVTLLAAHNTNGLYGAVFGILLPSLTYMFWSFASLLRILVHAMHGVRH